MNVIDGYQQKLFPYAYNILGSVDDAKDVIQEVMIKYMAVTNREVDNELGYLVRSVVNQSINVKKRNARIVTGTMWLPEPVETQRADTNIERREIISYSMMVLLEHLNPKERAVFILKEAFDYSHEDIASVLSITVENSRKLLSRARSGLKNNNNPPGLASDITSSYLLEYVEFIKNGDTGSLERKLSEEVSFMADGGGKVKIVRELTFGVQAVTDLLLYLYQTYQHNFTFRVHTINHQPALLYYKNNSLTNCQVFDIADGKIKNVYSIVDPEKLKNLLNL